MNIDDDPRPNSEADFEAIHAIGLSAPANGSPAFPTTSTTKWVWWSWSIKRQRWCKSCWDGDTRDEAIEARKHPLASELDRYTNVLVEEVTTFTAHPENAEVSREPGSKDL